MQRMMNFWYGALVGALVLMLMVPGVLSGDPAGLVPEGDPEEGEEEGKQEGSGGEESPRGLADQGPKRPEPVGGEPSSSSESTDRGLLDGGDDGDDQDGEDGEDPDGENRGRGKSQGDAGDEEDGQDQGSKEPDGGNEEDDEDSKQGQDPEPADDPAAFLRGRALPCVPGFGPQSRCQEGRDIPRLQDILMPSDEDDGDGGPHDVDEGGSDVQPFARSRVVVPEDGPGLLAWSAGVGLFAVLVGVLVRLFTVYHLGRGLLPAGWRLDRDRVVNHPVRREMLDHLKKQPGATIQEMADATGVANSRAAYHLSVLKREECVSERDVDGRRHFFLHAAPVVDPDRLRKRALGRLDRSPGRVLAFIRQSPGATVSHVARALGFSPGHAHYHLTRLAKQGLLDRVRRGRRVRHYLTSEGHELVVPQEESSVPGASMGSTHTDGLAA